MNVFCQILGGKLWKVITDMRNEWFISLPKYVPFCWYIGHTYTGYFIEKGERFHVENDFQQ